MFAHSYSEDSHERASVNNILQCIVQYSAGDEMTWQRSSSSLRSGAGSAFHVDGPATVKLHGP